MAESGVTFDFVGVEREDKRMGRISWNPYIAGTVFNDSIQYLFALGRKLLYRRVKRIIYNSVSI